MLAAMRTASVLAAVLLLGACSRDRERTDAYLSDLQGEVEKGVNGTIAACAPPSNRRDGLAIDRAKDVVAAYRLALEDQVGCVRREGCGRVEPSSGARDAEGSLAEADRPTLEAARRTLEALLAGGTTKEARGSIASAEEAGIDALGASAKLLVACRDRARDAEVPQAIKNVEEAHAKFRARVTAARPGGS